MPRTCDLPTDSVDAQVTIVGATMPKELVDSLQDMLLVRTDIRFFRIEVQLILVMHRDLVVN